MPQQICPVCHSSKNDIFVAHAYDRQFNLSIRKYDYFKCKVCSVVFISPFPNLDEIAEFYPHSDQYYAYDPRNVPETYRVIRKYCQDKNIFIQTQLRLFFPFINFEQTGRVLDFGCGVGHFLDGMKQLGWETCGIEIGDEAAAIATKNHHILEDVHQLINHYPEAYFDLITYFQSIEHLPKPVEVLKVIRKFQNPSGKTIITTPNTDCSLAAREKVNWRGLECPRHLCLFNPVSVSYLLTEAGFSKIQVKTRNAPSDLIGTMALAGRSRFKKVPMKIRYLILAPWVISSIIIDLGKGALLEASAQI